MTLLAIFLVASLVGPINGIFLALLLVAPITDKLEGLAVLVALAALIDIFPVTFVLTFIPATVLFCLWLHRVVRNMPALGASDPRSSPADTVGRCFIPFLNLLYPMAGVLEAWRGADPSHRSLNVAERQHQRIPVLMIAWWAFWLTGFWTSAIFWTPLYLPTDVGNVVSYAVEDRLAYSLIGVCGSVLTIIAALLAVLVVRTVTVRQDRKNMLITTGRLT